MAERLGSPGTSFAMHYCTRSADRIAFSARIGVVTLKGSRRSSAMNRASLKNRTDLG
jgi:hypothetical protein